MDAETRPLAADARNALSLGARLGALAAGAPFIALFALPDEALDPSLRALGLDRAEEPALAFEAAAVVGGAA